MLDAGCDKSIDPLPSLSRGGWADLASRI
jgi:hypothetical protein